MGFWRFQPQPSLPGLESVSALDYHLAVISGLVGLLGAYALFPAIERIRESDTAGARQCWLLAGAFSMAVGFWGMQSVGMLGFELPVTVNFDLRFSIFSVVPIAFGSAAALLVLGKPRPTLFDLHRAALGFSLGILGMHLSFMEALVMEADFTYSITGCLLSLAQGYAISFIAIYLSQSLQGNAAGTIGMRLLGSFMFGCAAFSVQHGTLAATTYSTRADAIPDASSVPPAALILAIVIAVALAIGLLFLGKLLDVRLGSAVQALRRSELRNRAVIQNMLDAHLIFDGTGTVTSFNTAAEVMFACTSEEIVGQPVTSLMGEMSTERFREWLSTDSGLERNVPLSTRQIRDAGARRLNGEVFPVEYSITSFVGNRGREFSCVLRDLTQQWATRQKLETLASAVEFSGDGIVILNADRSIAYVNPQFERQSGMEGARLLGRPASEVARLPPAVFAQMWEVARSGRSWSGHTTPRRPDGRQYEEDIILTPIRSAKGDITAFVAVFHDVSKRVADARENERLAAAVRYAADSIEILGPDGRIEYVNPAYERNQNMRLSEVVGRRPEEMEKVVVHDGNYYEMLKAARDEGKTWSGLLKSELTGGRLLEEYVTVSPIHDDNGGQTSFVIVKRDVTETRRLETQLQRARKLEAIGQLAAGIAHEINTPSQFVGDNLAFLQHSFDAMKPILSRLSTRTDIEDETLRALVEGAEVNYLLAEIPKAIAQSRDGCERISRIVQAMKVFSHPGAGMTAVDLNRAIQSTITVASAEWKYVAEVRLDLDPSLPQVVCQVGEVNQVILNLLVNAAHAIGDQIGDGANGKGVISVATRRCDTGVEISIEDTGAGIPSEIRERIFDPFFTTKEVGKGTGQGLAIAYDVIVHRHQGTIDVESEVGKGTRFIIRLPGARANSSASMAA